MPPSKKQKVGGKGMVVSLEGKVCIITGAASGIGHACVKYFLEAGAAGVVAVDVAKELNANLAELKCANLLSVTGSVAVDKTWKDATALATKKFGRLDVVVNIAGLGIFKPIDTHSEAEWDSVLGVNVKALWHASRHAIPVMKKQKSGLFLNTGSISSVTGMAAQGACTQTSPRPLGSSQPHRRPPPLPPPSPPTPPPPTHPARRPHTRTHAAAAPPRQTPRPRAPSRS